MHTRGPLLILTRQEFMYLFRILESGFFVVFVVVFVVVVVVVGGTYRVIVLCWRFVVDVSMNSKASVRASTVLNVCVELLVLPKLRGDRDSNARSSTK